MVLSRRFWIQFWCVLGIGIYSANALTTRDYAIEISATIQESPARITLSWRNNGDGLSYQLKRKLKSDTSWGSPVTISSGTTTYVDNSIQLGAAYEYSLTKSSRISGYICAGIKIPPIDQRGKIVLLVDNTYASNLSIELTRLQQDLVGDGWTVLRHDVSRNESPPQIKSIIQTDYNSDTQNVRAVFIFGHVPVPYSGDYNADDHIPHTGAWVADTYYADMDGSWTDNSVWNTDGTREANHNFPGDGKFDQSVIPSNLELEIGRVDFADLPAFLPRTEKDLLKKYLDKNHDYRNRVFTAQRRALLFDGFGESGGEAYAASGWRNFAPFFGSAKVQEIAWNQFFSTASSQDYLWSDIAGGGGDQYRDCYGVGETVDFANNEVKTVFTMIFGSFFGDWDATNDFMRAALGSGEILTAAWAGRPHWFFHHMALGENIGYSTLLTQNNNGNYLPTDFAREVHISLLGDPTLRMHVVQPPSSLNILFQSGTATISWSASGDSNLQGYHIYRATDANNSFTRLTTSPVTGLQFQDSPGSGDFNYMVRAVKLETSSSGSYYNQSEGIIGEVSIAPSITPVGISNVQISGTEVSFQCEGQTGQRFVIESSPNLENWLEIVTNTLTQPTYQFSETASNTALFFRTRLAP